MNVLELKFIASFFFLFFTRYHKNCYSSFVSERNVKAAQNQRRQSLDEPEDLPLMFVIRSMRNQPTNIWTSVELHDWYARKGGQKLTRSFMKSLLDSLGTEICCFNGPGIATLVMLKNKADLMFNKTALETNYCEELPISRVAQRIKNEAKDIPCADKEYSLVDDEAIDTLCIPTLEELFGLVCPRLRDKKIIALISSIVKTAISSKVTMLQVGLRLMIEQKKLINDMHSFLAG